MNFYLTKNGDKVGPYSSEQIQTFLKQGLASTTDKVWAEEWPEWMQIGNVPGLAPTESPEQTPSKDENEPQQKAIPEGSNRNKDDGEESTWNNILLYVARMPGVKVDRETYLRSILSKYYAEDQVNQAIAERPSRAGIPTAAITRFAKKSIAWHRTGVSAVAFIVGLPGPILLPVTVPADLGQFFFHVVVIAQKLAYLYGWPDFHDADKSKEDIDDNTAHILTIFVGVMLGAQVATTGLEELGKAFATQVGKRVPQMALTKSIIFQLSKQVAKWIGIKLTKDTFAKALAKMIPFVSAFIGGSITWWSFSVMSKRLRLHLEEMALAKP
jgi:uncharacterized membrane protein